MLMGALLIHLTGGRIETHFHVFGSLAFLAFYRDWRVLVPATIVVALDHLLRGIFWPQSVYGVLVASQWRWLEHAAWVVFEDVFLVVSCLRSVAEMRQTGGAHGGARAGSPHAPAGRERCASLHGGAVGLALTRGTELPVDAAEVRRRARAAPRRRLRAHLDASTKRGQTLELAGDRRHCAPTLDAAHSRVPVGRFAIGAIARDRQPLPDSRAPTSMLPIGGADWARRKGLAVVRRLSRCCSTRSSSA